MLHRWLTSFRNARSHGECARGAFTEYSRGSNCRGASVFHAHGCDPYRKTLDPLDAVDGIEPAFHDAEKARSELQRGWRLTCRVKGLSRVGSNDTEFGTRNQLRTCAFLQSSSSTMFSVGGCELWSPRSFPRLRSREAGRAERQWVPRADRSVCASGGACGDAPGKRARAKHRRFLLARLGLSG